MEENVEFEGSKPKMISYYEHEAEVARLEKNARRWMIAAVVAFVAFAGAFVYEATFQDVVTETFTAETDQGGDALNLIAKDKGTLNYGESDLHADENTR